jgi:hypothetical protein
MMALHRDVDAGTFPQEVYDHMFGERWSKKVERANRAASR